jgi:hypothetical protein
LQHQRYVDARARHTCGKSASVPKKCGGRHVAFSGRCSTRVHDSDAGGEYRLESIDLSAQGNDLRTGDSVGQLTGVALLQVIDRPGQCLEIIHRSHPLVAAQYRI